MMMSGPAADEVSNKRGLPRGVYRRGDGKFYAAITVKKKYKHLGAFMTADMAAAAYRKARAEAPAGLNGRPCKQAEAAPAKPEVKPAEASVKVESAKPEAPIQKYRLRRLSESPPTPSLERQLWLEKATEALRERFAGLGYALPVKLRYSIGWPKLKSCGASAETWAASASSDGHIEQFISPEANDSPTIISWMTHEHVHAAVGVEAGHGPAFKQCALALGLVGKMRSTTMGEEAAAWTEALFKRIGPYPGGSLALATRKKQSARLLKCVCGTCGDGKDHYSLRITRKWLDELGPPVCPGCGLTMVEEDAAPA
jgi:hypothetical protein